MTVGGTIVSIRNKLGITQTELAKKTDISRSVMNRIELGTRPVRDDELKKISKLLNVSADYLIGNTKEPLIKQNEPKKPKDLANFLEESEVMFDGEVHKLTNESRQKLRNALEFAFYEARKMNKCKKD